MAKRLSTAVRPDGAIQPLKFRTGPTVLPWPGYAVPPRAIVTHARRNAGPPVVAALRRAGWEVIELPTALEALERGQVHEDESSDREAGRQAKLMEAWEAFAAQHRPDLFIPTRQVAPWCRMQDAGRLRIPSLLPSYAACATAEDKARISAIARDLGIAVPEALDLDSAQAFLASHSEAAVIVKPRRDVGGGVGVHVVRSPSELNTRYHETASRFGSAFVSEYIPGPTEQLRALHLLFDKNTRLIAQFVLQKSRLAPVETGVTVAGLSTHELHLVEAVLPLFHALRWCGPADLEMKIDSRDGRAKLLEINARFSGAIRFPIGCGIDLPALYARAAQGERLPAAEGAVYPAGVRYLDARRWCGSVWSELRGRGLNLAMLRRSYGELRQPRVGGLMDLIRTAVE